MTFIYYTTQIMSKVELDENGKFLNSKIVSQFTRETHAPKKAKVIPKPKKKPKVTVNAVTESVQTRDF